MSALQFLNKKSWHTATIKNNEKVWLKEQAAEKEKKRIEELQKQLAEERKLQEIQRLEEKSGRLDPAELLKRRRLNWMYEHGPDKDEDKQKEKDREDMLLGRKEIDLDKLQKPVNHTSVAEEEAKMREDPLVKIELERARILKLAGRDPSRRTDPEREAKMRRKEERARIREERRVRREKRALRRSRHSQDTGGDEGRKETTGGEREMKGEIKKPKTSHKRKMEELREMERRLLADTYHSSRESDEEQTPEPKRRRREDSSERNERSIECSRRDQDRCDDRDRKYGLSLPENGSGVAVTREFVPRSRRRRWDERGDEGRDLYHERRRGSVSPDRRRHRESRRRLNGDERERRLEEMRRDADRVDEERRQRLKRHARDEREERNHYSREDPTRSFARDCISAGISAGSAADRIRQRRAWATRDGDAAY